MYPSGYRVYCTFELTHCCFGYLLGKKSPDLVMDTGYRHVQVAVSPSLLIDPIRNEIYIFFFFGDMFKGS